MPLFWFLAGILITLATLALLAPWLRNGSLVGSLAKPWRAVASAAILVAAIFGLHHGLGQPPSTGSVAHGAADRVGNGVADSFVAASKAFGNAAGPTSPAVGDRGDSSTKTSAGSMDSAIANLKQRLAKGGGNPDDWELLAKSFEFVHRPADAAKARAHDIPALSEGREAAAAAPAVSGEILLDAALSGKTATGDTLFIVAKSIDSPGMPVAVLRASVASWPLKFTLDDSQSMVAGRNLSNAGRLTIEARISKKGQPLPATGDLRGSSGAIDPAVRKPLKIIIDHEIS